jgi:hypothetical protein
MAGLARHLKWRIDCPVAGRASENGADRGRNWASGRAIVKPPPQRHRLAVSLPIAATASPESTQNGIASKMTKIVWIASYPRSGNTWVRFLIGNLLYSSIETSAQLAMTVPDIHQFITGRHLRGTERSFIKTHWTWQPDFPLREDTQSVLYLIRNPIDVMTSSLNYGLRSTGRFARDASPADIDRYARQFVGQFIDHFGDAGWYRQGFGNWEENAASWIESDLPFPRLVMRYESLRADPVGSLTAIAAFSGLNVVPARIREAIDRSSVERLAQIEEQEIKEGTPGMFTGARASKAAEAGFRFIGGGATQAPARLTDNERSRALEKFAPAMRRFGYD